MKSFLASVKDEVLAVHGMELADLAIIFPTHRAAGSFRKILGEGLDRPVLAPSVWAVRDFIYRLAGRQPADDLTLLFELYSVYRKSTPAESFDSFLGWGEMLLADFNEVDLHMVNAAHLFSNVSDFKKIESEFGLDQEDARKIGTFWQLFSSRALSRPKEAFLHTWSGLYPLYRDYKSALEGKGLAYEGMAWQLALSRVRNGSAPVHWPKIYFAGFYGLSAVHRQLLDALGSRAVVESLYDADVYYTDDTAQEAGLYFHRKKMPDGGFRWKGNHFSAKKSIAVAGTALSVGQAKYTGARLAEMLQLGAFDPVQTVVVLPDETMLVPLLQSLPPGLGPVSVSMGYPLRLSALAGLVDELARLHARRRVRDNGNASFLSRDLANLISHPYLSGLDPLCAQKAIVEITRSRLIRIDADDGMLDVLDPVQRMLVTPAQQPQDILQMVKAAAKSVSASSPGIFSEWERSLAGSFLGEIEKTESLLAGHLEFVTVEAAWLLLKRLVRFMKVPFSGDADGMQVMGMLETRAMDFEHVFVLSLNEGILPPSPAFDSYIPAALRKGFGLPGHEERDAAYAYHFYRLLQRASDVHLLYDTEVKSLRGGEKSRFLYQLAYELPRKAPAVNIEFKVVSAPPGMAGPETIRVEKTDKVVRLMDERFFAGSDTASGFSATALSTYISCPLRFYFRNLAELKEPETFSETVEADAFGRILHDAVQKIYSTAGTVTEEQAGALHGAAAAATADAVRKEFPHVRGEGEGLFYIKGRVIETLVNRLIEADSRLAPFRIESLEKKYTASIDVGATGRKALLKGFLDRVHIKDDVYCIVDYKTGNDKVRFPIRLDKVFEDPQWKPVFQLLFYSLLFRHNHPGRTFRAGLYRMKSLDGGIQYLHGGDAVPDDLLQAFAEGLQGLIGEIINPAVAFTQTADEKRCTHCPYREICNR